MSGRTLRQRIATAAVLFALVFAALCARAVHLTIMQGDRLAERATRQQQQEVPMTAQRGASAIATASRWRSAANRPPSTCGRASGAPDRTR